MELNLPICDLKIRIVSGKYEVFDITRKKYVMLTNEEWVRQHFIHYLVNHLRYPKSLISSESGLIYNELQKRTDIVVYDRVGQPFMLVECKAPTVPVSQAVFSQAACYNHTLKARYLTVTNGMQHYCFRINREAGCLDLLKELPRFDR